MPIDPETVRKTAHLARLQIDDAELDRVAGQLGIILDYVGQLADVDVSKVEPLVHAGEFTNVMRPDEPRPTLDAETAVANAPEKLGTYFVVPRVLEEP